MNSKTLRAKYLKFAILIISVCFLLGAISACLPFNISIPELDNNAINDTAMTITTNTIDGLGEFNDGYSYVYTDKNKVDGYRAGTEDYDITIHKVAKTSNNRGTQDNPYVIATTADWETFVKYVSTDSDHGNGEYFVLGCDLDFSSVTTFRMVAIFNGTFYGMGHSLSNIICDTWQYWNNGSYVNIGTSGYTDSCYGLFCKITGATITDLIVKDYSYLNPPVSASLLSGHGPFVGGMTGVLYGDTSILNCHTQGEIKYTTSYYPFVAGIVSAQFGTDSNMLVYRCSVELDATIGSSVSPYIGGIFGRPFAGNSTSILDCVANLRATITASNSIVIACSAVSSFCNTSPQLLENFVGTVDIVSSVTGNPASIVCIQNTSSPMSIKNCYAEGTYASSSTDTVKKSLCAMTVSNSSYASSSFASSCNSVENSNGYISAGGYVRYNGNVYGSSNALIAKAKSEVGNNFSSKIWDADKIGGSYDSDNTPVRNYLMAFINFRNLKNGGADEESVGLPDGEPYIVGDKLPDATSDVTAFTTYLNNKKNANHEFKGWTNDPTGNSEPFTELPQGYFGDVTLYAVWGLPDSYVISNIKTSLTSDKNLIEYDSVESITLTAKVEHTAPSSGSMTNPSATYYFVQDGEEKITSANVKSSGVLSVKTVKDSGKYTFKYRLTDGLEPLWRYDGTPSNSVDIKIEKGKLEHMTLKDFKISTSTIPYFGKKLEDIDFTASMLNKADKEVVLTEVKWKSTIGKVDTKGTNTKKIVLCPVDTDNYEKEYVFDATFESQSLVIIFNMAQISQKVEV
ncbi:MAG: hypothetical protein K2I46_07575, partial [Clostridia bacterium]|nr:hypothetical protein [Clostridia bacterium]